MVRSDYFGYMLNSQCQAPSPLPFHIHMDYTITEFGEKTQIDSASKTFVKHCYKPFISHFSVVK